MDRRSLLLLPLAAPFAAHAAPAVPRALLVFAAASLTTALRDIAQDWHQQGHPAPVQSFASSSTLARQIEEGAQANIFASADEKWMDWVQQRGLILPATRRDLLSNRLVLVVPKDRARRITIGPGLDLASLLGKDGRLAVGNPSNVPAGIYAKQALQHLGLWRQAEPRLARAENVRQALLLVERGEAPAGIVYATDAAVAPNLVVAGVFPAGSHAPITYPFAIVKGGDTPQAHFYLDFLAGPQARAAFTRQGFIVKG